MDDIASFSDSEGTDGSFDGLSDESDLEDENRSLDSGSNNGFASEDSEEPTPMVSHVEWRTRENP
ncbi:MAG: hypothetical protein L6R41_008053, partial [Letrouitia leprolyta]